MKQNFRNQSIILIELPANLKRLEEPQLALENLKGLIVIDKIQRKPDLFPLLRAQTADPFQLAF